jgi:hypothetical protein
MSEFMATSEGVQLTRAFVRISDPQVRRRLVELVETIADSHAAH